MNSSATPILGLLETSIYVDDLDRSQRFYQDLFAFDLLLSDERMRALSVGGRTVLLLFRKGASNQSTAVPGGIIPPHDSQGQSHLAFAISADSLTAWIERLAQFQVALISTVHAPRGGISIYFRDPDDHLLELATPGIWPTDAA